MPPAFFIISPPTSRARAHAAPPALTKPSLLSLSPPALLPSSRRFLDYAPLWAKWPDYDRVSRIGP